MKKLRTAIALPLILSIVVFNSCQKEDLGDPSFENAKAKQESKSNTFYGPQESMGDGKARSFVTITHDGQPLELGIIFTHSSMFGLSSDPMNQGGNTFHLELHKKASEVTPFTFFMVNWNPMGHPPAVYAAPHFDIHYYLNMTMEEQMMVSMGPDMFLYPPAGHLPASYVPGAPVPMMGHHWSDPASPEFHGQPFTQTFIYGSYGGEVIFYEPMITRDYLLSGSTSSLAFPLPTMFSPDHTWYPTRYRVYTDEKGNIIVSLSDFVWR
jgi:hypothetical protein